MAYKIRYMKKNINTKIINAWEYGSSAFKIRAMVLRSEQRKYDVA